MKHIFIQVSSYHGKLQFEFDCNTISSVEEANNERFITNFSHPD